MRQLLGVPALALALASCEPAREARFSASCAPDEARETVRCTVTNHGTKAGRACITPRVQPPTGVPIIGQRLCTKSIEPGAALTMTAMFDQLERARRDTTLASRCARNETEWICKTDVVEQSSLAMTDNAPR
jgi:hypothetical protein